MQGYSIKLCIRPKSREAYYMHMHIYEYAYGRRRVRTIIVVIKILKKGEDKRTGDN